MGLLPLKVNFVCYSYGFCYYEPVRLRVEPKARLGDAPSS